jgi:hypothetical protein
MFNNDITLAGDASSTRTYSLTSIVDGKSIRSVAALTGLESEVLTISHVLENPKDKLSSERHLVRLDLTKVDTTSGVAYTGSVYVVVVEPPLGVTSTMLKDMRTQIVNFFATSGYFDRVLNKEP